MSLIRNMQEWTQDDKERLLNLYCQMPEEWTQISIYMNKSVHSCIYQYKILCGLLQKVQDRAWTIEEDERLTDLINRFSFEWRHISHYFPNCNAATCYLRFVHFNVIRQLDQLQSDGHAQQFKEKSRWSEEEKNKLRAIWNQNYNLADLYTKIYKQFPNRSEAACKIMLRRMGAISRTPLEQKGEVTVRRIIRKWSVQELILLKDKYEQYKSCREKWKKISQCFQSRTPYSCEQQYRLKVKKSQQQ